jgi:hypothetical protein
VLQTDATYEYKAEIIKTVEYLRIKYAKDQVVNIVKSHEAIKQIRIQQLNLQQSLKNNKPIK